MLEHVTQHVTPAPGSTRLSLDEQFPPYQRISSRPTQFSLETKSFCAQGMFFYDVKLRDGWNAGMLLNVARVNSMTECVQLCCEEPACDFVMFRSRKCYTVRCRGGDTCTVDEGGVFQISFVSRQGNLLMSPLTAWFIHVASFLRANSLEQCGRLLTPETAESL